MLLKVSHMRYQMRCSHHAVQPERIRADSDDDPSMRLDIISVLSIIPLRDGKDSEYFMFILISLLQPGRPSCFLHAVVNSYMQLNEPCGQGTNPRISAFTRSTHCDVLRNHLMALVLSPLAPARMDCCRPAFLRRRWESQLPWPSNLEIIIATERDDEPRCRSIDPYPSDDPFFRLNFPF
nr:hypothetical protein CFP56_50352 [Quercus suber]